MTRAAPPTPSWLVATIVLIIVAASVARLQGLDRMVVWHDEVFTAVRVFGYDQEVVRDYLFSGRLLAPSDLLGFQTPRAENGWDDTFRALGQHPEHSPLYYLAARLVSAVVGDPLIALRGTAAVLSLLLPLAVSGLMRELFGPGKAPWIVAGLLVVSPLHLLYAQEAREYALWTVAIAAASAAFLRALRRQRSSDWVLYGGLVAFGLYSHVLFALMIPLHGFYGYLALRATPGGIATTGRAWLLATGLGTALFVPWLYLFAVASEQVANYTEWMLRPVGLDRVLVAWGEHLLRLFAEIPVPLAGWGVLGLWLLALVMWRFCVAAPRPSRWFVCLLMAVSIAAVLVPDLLFGGSRSLHARYVLPTLLAVHLAVAQVLAAEWDAPRAVRRWASAGAVVSLLGLGLWSSMALLQAETAWTKNYSAANAAVARQVNASEHPLVLVSDGGVAIGEIISLAYYLEESVGVWGEPKAGDTTMPAGFGALFALTPSAPLREELEKTYVLVPMENTWQWYRLVPKTPPLQQYLARSTRLSSAPEVGSHTPPWRRVTSPRERRRETHHTATPWVAHPL